MRTRRGFYNNPSLYFYLPFFRNHDHFSLDIFGYDLRCRDDDGTAQIRGLCDQWRRCQPLADREILDQIRADRIDVLVDTTGHFAGHRLHLLCYRAAPVQVAMLNYPATTGLKCLDGIVTDPWVCPEGSEDQYSEPALRLSSGFLPYAPPECAPPVTPPPAANNGYITFGLFQRPVKISRAAWDAIAQVLHETAGSRLLIHNAFPHLAFPGSYMQDLYLREFASRGIDPSRIRFSGPTAMEQHLHILAEADIALDTFPYNGQTTTCECLWMGVPVVTLTGGYHVARVGRSVLHRAGFPQWETFSGGEYVDLAASLASGIEALAAIRASMRQQVAASVLLDGQKITRELETTYRFLWRRWCKEKKAYRPALDHLHSLAPVDCTCE